MTIVFKNIDLTNVENLLYLRRMSDMELMGEFDDSHEKITNYIHRCLASIGPEAFLHVYANSDSLIGQIELGQKDNSGHIHLFYLLPEYRGKGYFKLMHAKAMEIFSKNGFTRIQLATTSNNKHAMEVYKKYGWKNIGPYTHKPNMIAFKYHLDNSKSHL